MRFRKDFVGMLGSVMGMDILSYFEDMEKKHGEDGRKKKTSWLEKKPRDDVKAKMDSYKSKAHKAAPKRDYGYYDKGRRKETYMDAETAKSKAPAHAAPVCQYCKSNAHIKTAKEYKGREDDYCYWVCPTCVDVCVTTIKGSYFASGEMANTDLRKLRSTTHQQIAFKKEELHHNRMELQHWIATVLKVEREEAKIGVLSDKQLEQLVKGANSEYYATHYADIFERSFKEGEMIR